MSEQQALVDKILTLPPDKLDAVNLFVDQLLNPSTVEDEADSPLLSIAGSLSGEPLSSDEIEAELYG